jgi:hypothetical protein
MPIKTILEQRNTFVAKQNKRQKPSHNQEKGNDRINR